MFLIRYQVLRGIYKQDVFVNDMSCPTETLANVLVDSGSSLNDNK